MLIRQHLIADTSRPSDTAYFRSSAWNAAQLASIDGDIFHEQKSTAPIDDSAHDLPANTTFITPYHEMRMQPPGPLAELEPHAKDMPLPAEASAAIDAAVARVQDPSALLRATRRGREKNAEYAASFADGLWNGPGANMRISTLGTGSAIPSKYRNVSATMLEVPDLTADGKTGRILLDAGEGTLGQMRRLFGVEGMRKFYVELGMVFISHMHADHHLGLQAVLEDRFAVSRHSRFIRREMAQLTLIARRDEQAVRPRPPANRAVVARVGVVAGQGERRGLGQYSVYQFGTVCPGAYRPQRNGRCFRGRGRRGRRGGCAHALAGVA